MNQGTFQSPFGNDEHAPEESPKADLTGIDAVFRTIFRVLIATPFHTALLLIALGFDTAFTVAVPISFRYLVDHAISSKDGAALVRVLAILAIGLVIASAAATGRDYLWARFLVSVLNRIRTELFDHLLDLSMDFFARREIAEITARFSTDLASIEGALAAAPAWALVPLLDSIVSLVMLFVLDWRLALVASLVVPVSLLGPRLIMSRAAKAGYQQKTDEAGLLGVVQEAIAAHTVVRAFGLEQAVTGRFKRSLSTLDASSIRAAISRSLLERSSGITTLILQVVVLGVGATMAYSKQLTIGSLAAFQTLFMTLAWSIGYISQYFPSLLQAAAGMRRIHELIDVSPRVSDKQDAGVLTKPGGSVIFERVMFGYDHPHQNLTDLSLDIQAGTSVAFVGPSGCGKSTVLSLLMRFYDPSSGRIVIGGQDISTVTQASLRAQIGVVFQDTILFNTSIRENIRLGKIDATNAEVETAARAAEIHDLILTLRQGYDTPVGERGGRLSGGQRQRIAIARAILRNPQILVLDEATSALDSEAEAAVNQTLSRLGTGRTVVSVSHRLASVAACDRIFVLDSGRLAESGSHKELLGNGKLYSRLWRKQTSVSTAGESGQATIDASTLGEIPIFRSLDSRQLVELAAALATERIPAGREIYRQGDRGDKLYVVARGTVAVSGRVDGTDGEQMFLVLEDGDYFGEIALIVDQPRIETVRTRTDCVLLTLPSEAFRRLLDNYPGLRAKVLLVLRERLIALATPPNKI
jgi:ATP-binding cassette, subfamily B, bacterial